jgi:hypothetical protein
LIIEAGQWEVNKALLGSKSALNTEHFDLCSPHAFARLTACYLKEFSFMLEAVL